MPLHSKSCGCLDISRWFSHLTETKPNK